MLGCDFHLCDGIDRQVGPVAILHVYLLWSLDNPLAHSWWIRMAQIRCEETSARCRPDRQRRNAGLNTESRETMTFEDSTNSDLRQQLREAWHQIAELEWQLQAEQRNSRKQDSLLASQGASLAESRDEHEQALADRDQDIADLEDEHYGIVTGLENDRRDGAQRAQWDLRA